MTVAAPTIEAFFVERLSSQRQASPRTITAYRDTWRLLLGYVHARTGKLPAQLDIADLDAGTIAAFLAHLEQERGNSVNTRNARLAAIRSLFRYASLRHPEHADLIRRVLAIPAKRHDRTDINYLNTGEIDALLAAPDRHTWLGRRDYALILLAIQTGLRVSELTALTAADLQLARPAQVNCVGKGRKHRATPLTTDTVAVLRVWLQEQKPAPTDPLFSSRNGGRLSTDAVQWLLTKHATAASTACRTLAAKTISPHVLRHTCAMNLLHAGIDTSVIALWLGHESVQTTQIYIHADLTLKERALARTAPPNTNPGRYRPPDVLLAFLEAL